MREIFKIRTDDKGRIFAAGDDGKPALNPGGHIIYFDNFDEADEIVAGWNVEDNKEEVESQEKNKKDESLTKIKKRNIKEIYKVSRDATGRIFAVNEKGEPGVNEKGGVIFFKNFDEADEIVGSWNAENSKEKVAGNVYKIRRADNGKLFAVDENNEPCVYEDGGDIIFFDSMEEAEEIVGGWNKEEDEKEAAKPGEASKEEVAKAEAIINAKTTPKIDAWYKENRGTIFYHTAFSINDEYYEGTSEDQFMKKVTVARGIPMVFSVVVGGIGFLLLSAGIILALMGIDNDDYVKFTNSNTFMGYGAGGWFGVWAVWVGFWGFVAVAPFLNLQDKKANKSEKKILGTWEGDMKKYTGEEVDAIVKTALAQYEADAVIDNQALLKQNAALSAENVDVRKQLDEANASKKGILLDLFSTIKLFPEIAKKMHLDKVFIDATPSEIANMTGISTKEAYNKFFKKEGDNEKK